MLCGCCYVLGEVEALLDRVRGLIGKCSTYQSDCPAMCRVLQLLIEAAPRRVSQDGTGDGTAISGLKNRSEQNNTNDDWALPDNIGGSRLVSQNSQH